MSKLRQKALIFYNFQIIFGFPITIGKENTRIIFVLIQLKKTVSGEFRMFSFIISNSPRKREYFLHEMTFYYSYKHNLIFILSLKLSLKLLLNLYLFKKYSLNNSISLFSISSCLLKRLSPT